jgi:predicted alpha/beta-fold hydrolase
MEIIYGNTLDKRHQINYKREILLTPDGENLALDWDDTDLKNKEAESSPIVIYLPGLSGNSTSSYVRKSIYEMRDKGFRSAVFNTRGSLIPQITPNLHDFKIIFDDLDFVISHIKKNNPNSNIYFVGFSLGSSYGAKYISFHPDRIKGMVCVANPFNVFQAGKSLNSYKNSIYS